MPYADISIEKQYQKKYRKLHKKEHIEYNRKYRKNNRKKLNFDNKWKNIFDRHGITIEQYNDIFIKQNGCCDICGTHQSMLKRNLAVDHCHVSNVNRGLLCQKCNNAIGLLNDSVDLIEKCKIYLQKHKERIYG